MDTINTDSQIDKQRDEVRAKLAELGGGLPSEDDLRREGRTLIVPENWTLDDTIQYLRDYKERDNQITTFDRTFPYRPLDGARALNQAIRKAFGMSAMLRRSFWGPAPSLRTITVDASGNTEQVPTGEMEMPLFKGTIHLSAERDEDLGILFQLIVQAPRRFRNEVEGLFRLVEAELAENSIYKGTAIFGSTEPEFLPLNKVNPDHVIYSEETLRQLDTNVWANCRYTEEMRANDIPLKRAVLLHGEYGTGKTLAAYRTAQVAVENGWTFLYCRPEKDDIFEVMATARIYAPSIVFFEDVDTIAHGEGDGVSRLLDLFDGITSKGNELMVMLTTNHPEKIHKGMLRAGRLDAVIEIGNLDRQGTEALIRSVVADEQLDPDVDFDSVHEAMAQFAPAFVKEAIDRAKRNSIRRNGGTLGVLTTEDFEFGALDLESHLRMQQDASEGKELDSLGQALQREVAKVLSNSRISDPTYELNSGVWGDPEEGPHPVISAEASTKK